MRETWLRSNTRVLWPVMAVGGLLTLVGLGLGAAYGFAAVASWLCLALGLSTLAVCGWLFSRPRLAYVPGHLLVYVQRGSPIRLPIEATEAFLLGQGPSYLPGNASRLDTSTLVLKLAERYPEWAQVECNHTLAGWCNHYVTFRGAWCEPLNLELVNRLNARLAEAARQHGPKRAEPQGAR